MRSRTVATLSLALVAVLANPPAARAGAVFISGDDADDQGHCQGTACGALYPTVLRLLHDQCDPVPTDRDGILAIGLNGDPALASFLSWNDVNNGGPGAYVHIVTDPVEIATIRLEDYRVLYLPSSENNTQGGIETAQLGMLNSRAADIQTYINQNNGRLLSLTEGGMSAAYGWLPAPLTYLSFSFGQDNIDPTPNMHAQFPGTQANAANMDHCCYHTVWTGPAGYSGLHVLAVTKLAQVPDPSDPTVMIDGPVIVGGCSVKLTPVVCDATNHNDPNCWTCGNGWLDPGELCDDGNLNGGDGCESDCRPTIGFCATVPGRLYPLLGVRSGSEAQWSWPGQIDSRDGYRVYSVLAKADLDASQPGKGARGSNPAATLECETTTQTSTGCVDADAFDPLTPPLLFCQVVGRCASTEGAN